MDCQLCGVHDGEHVIGCMGPEVERLRLEVRLLSDELAVASRLLAEAQAAERFEAV